MAAQVSISDPDLAYKTPTKEWEENTPQYAMHENYSKVLLHTCLAIESSMPKIFILYSLLGKSGNHHRRMLCLKLQ